MRALVFEHLAHGKFVAHVTELGALIGKRLLFRIANDFLSKEQI